MAQGAPKKKKSAPLNVKKTKTKKTSVGISHKKNHGKGAITKKGHFDVTQKKRVPPHAKEDKVRDTWRSTDNALARSA